MRLMFAFLLLMTAASGTAIVFTRDPRRMVVALAASGLVLATLFMVLQAPDVAFAELAVGAAAVPLLYLVVLNRLRTDLRPPPDAPE